MNAVAASDVMEEAPCVFGYNTETQTGLTPISIWNKFSSTDNKTDVRFAIRFIGTDYCSVWRYQQFDHDTESARIVISARLIEKIESTDYSSMTSIMKDASGNDPDFWSADNLKEENGGVQRVFYLCGYNGTDGQDAPGYQCPGNGGMYWALTTDPNNTNNGWYLETYKNSLYMRAFPKTMPFTLRLFRDK